MKPQMALRGRAANTWGILYFTIPLPQYRYLPAASAAPHSAAASPRDALQRRRAAPTPSPRCPFQDTMPEKRLTRSNHRTEQALTNHPAIIAYVCVGLVFCIVSCFKVFGHRRRRKFSKKQLERMRDWRDGRAETKVESQIRKMKDKLKTMKQRRRLERGRDAHERLLDEAEARRDARGREVYGDEWDNPDNDGNQTASFIRVRACIAVQHPRRGPLRGSLSIKVR